MDQPPWNAQRLFGPPSRCTPNGDALLVPEIKLLELDQIVTDGFVDSIFDKQSSNIGCLRDVSYTVWRR